MLHNETHLPIPPDCSDLELLLMDYAARTLPPQERARVAAHLAQCPACQQKAAQYSSLLTALDDLPPVMPPMGLRDDFQAMLAAEKALVSATSQAQSLEAKVVPLHPVASASAASNTVMWLRIAASIALLAVGTVFGLLLRQPTTPEIATTTPAADAQQLAARLTAATQQPATASHRIQLVSDASGNSRPGDPTVLVLINTLNSDPNPNVRLAAADALYRLRADSLVAPALIQALPVQTDPNVQITLIELLVKLRDKKAVPQLKRLSQRPDALPAVRDQARQGISILI
ncbi:Putative zinc-finger [Hymenobacter gelipurpurascens]|uniref:Putative zinc-finger n=1 Tax=Hymenobacter gelipurpurascens TaxID=89968 RepID=A0A212UAD6_9BACT|nr:HEAT repeat domain-containing protein [Hymenobacter gelipurpurascens]SNC75014.1 Putative zinc-finger [Hymenobacter gelipurpurascens]